MPRSFEGTERYELVRVLGRGGMGVVYEAFDHRYGNSVALKLLPVARADLLLRFKREFRLAAEIRHPNLVQLGELVAHQDHWFFTMDLINGVDFVSHVRGREAIHAMTSGFVTRAPSRAEPEAPTVLGSTRGDSTAGVSHVEVSRLRPAFAGLVRGLCALHGVGCVHRDIKPSNVIVENGGRVVVLDFGLASFAPKETTLFGAGTPAYMAPEQAGQKAVGPSADWYSVGVILFELLTGRLPFSGGANEIIVRKQGERAPPVLAITPDSAADLASLCDALLQPEPRHRPDAARILEVFEPGASALPPVSAAPLSHAALVGRDEEQRHLEEMLEGVANGDGGRAVILVGEAGIGKSAIARAFVERLQASERTITFSSRCHERELVPYKAIDGIVDAIVNWLSKLEPSVLSPLVPENAGVLVRAFPVLGRLEAFREAAHVDRAFEQRHGRARLFSAFRELVQSIASARTVVFSIDDLHWGDDDSLALVSEALAPPSPPRLLVIATAWERVFGRDTKRVFSVDVNETRLNVSGLSNASAAELAQLRAGEARLEQATLERLVRESAGHPLFLLELVESALAEGAVPSTLTLEAVLSRKIRSLAAPARKLLAMVVIAGAPLDATIAGDAAEVPRQELHRAVSDLRAARLVLVVRHQDRDQLEPSHDRVRTAVSAHLGEGGVRPLHVSLAKALEQAGDHTASAAHWRAAGEGDRAAEHYRAAAELAARALAFDDCAEQYRVALELGKWSDAERTQLEVARSDALANAGKGALAVPGYLAAAEGTTFERRARFYRRAAEELIWSGHLREGLAVGRSILREAGMRMARLPLLALLLQRLLLRLRGLDYLERRKDEADPRQLERIDLCWAYSSGLVLTDHVQGAYFQALGLWFALRYGDSARVARSLAAEAAYVAGYAKYEESRPVVLIDKAERLSRRLDDDRASGTVQMMSGIADHLRGDFARARVRLEGAIDTLRERCTGTTWELDACQQFRLDCLFYLGELGPFSEAVEHGTRQAQVRGSLYTATNLQTGLANASWLIQGRAVQAREYATDAISRWPGRGFHIQHWYDVLAQTQIDLYEGRGAAACERVERAWPLLSRSHLLRVGHVRVAATHLRGRAALAALAGAAGRDRARAIRLAKSSGRALRTESAPWANALSALIDAGILRCQEDPLATEALEVARSRLAASELGLYRMVLETVLGSREPTELVALGVKSPALFARMLLPGLCSTLALDAGSEHAQ